jgi:hypothetical protein
MPRVALIWVLSLTTGCIRHATPPGGPCPGALANASTTQKDTPATQATPLVVRWQAMYMPRNMPDGKDDVVEFEMVPGTRYFPADSEAGGWKCHYEAVETSERGELRTLACVKDGHWARTTARCSARVPESEDDYSRQDEASLVIGFRDERGEGGQMLVRIQCWAASGPATPGEQAESQTLQ